MNKNQIIRKTKHCILLPRTSTSKMSEVKNKISASHLIKYKSTYNNQYCEFRQFRAVQISHNCNISRFAQF